MARCRSDGKARAPVSGPPSSSTALRVREWQRERAGAAPLSSSRRLRPKSQRTLPWGGCILQAIPRATPRARAALTTRRRGRAQPCPGCCTCTGRGRRRRWPAQRKRTRRRAQPSASCARGFIGRRLRVRARGFGVTRGARVLFFDFFLCARVFHDLPNRDRGGTEGHQERQRDDEADRGHPEVGRGPLDGHQTDTQWTAHTVRRAGDIHPAAGRMPPGSAAIASVACLLRRDTAGAATHPHG